MHTLSGEATPTVLVVDDEVLLRLDASEVLQASGCRVIEAGSADEAISILETTGHVDLVVTDVQMPGSMDGLKLTSLINSRWPETAVIVTSGRIRPRAHELPANVRFFSKPYSPSKLADVAMRLPLH